MNIINKMIAKTIAPKNNNSVMILRCVCIEVIIDILQGYSNRPTLQLMRKSLFTSNTQQYLQILNCPAVATVV
jgi:hypothetical protein